MKNHQRNDFQHVKHIRHFVGKRWRVWALADTTKCHHYSRSPRGEMEGLVLNGTKVRYFPVPRPRKRRCRTLVVKGVSAQSDDQICRFEIWIACWFDLLYGPEAKEVVILLSC